MARLPAGNRFRWRASTGPGRFGLSRCLQPRFSLVLRAVHGRVEVGIRYGNHCLRVDQEPIDQRVQFFHSLRFARGQIVLLANILTQIEELPTVRAAFAAVKNADQFPVVLMHGDRRR